VTFFALSATEILVGTLVLITGTAPWWGVVLLAAGVLCIVVGAIAVWRWRDSSRRIPVLLGSTVFSVAGIAGGLIWWTLDGGLAAILLAILGITGMTFVGLVHLARAKQVSPAELE
jgi:multisubunit Na+/H+ antiporter MnhG subunit